MKIITYNDNDINANTYLIINNDEAIIIDPANDLTMIKKELASIKLVGIFLTHGHYDHVLAVEKLKERYNIPVYAAKEEEQVLKDKRMNQLFDAGSDGFEVRVESGHETQFELIFHMQLVDLLFFDRIFDDPFTDIPVQFGIGKA